MYFPKRDSFFRDDQSKLYIKIIEANLNDIGVKTRKVYESSVFCLDNEKGY